MSENYNRQSIDATLSRIETKLDAALVTQNGHGTELESLKKWKWFSSGIGAIIGFLADKIFSK